MLRQPDFEWPTMAEIRAAQDAAMASLPADVALHGQTAGGLISPPDEAGYLKQRIGYEGVSSLCCSATKLRVIQICPPGARSRRMPPLLSVIVSIV